MGQPLYRSRVHPVAVVSGFHCHRGLNVQGGPLSTDDTLVDGLFRVPDLLEIAHGSQFQVGALRRNDLAVLHPTGTIKDNARCGRSDAMLLDDQAAVVAPSEESRWIPIAKYLPPYSDHENSRYDQIQTG